jgi:branched-subunit amino acid ABC-type transport system permease component
MTAFFAADWLNDNGVLNTSPFIAVPIILVVGAVSSTIVALLLERIAYRPLRRAPRLVPLITAIGASLFISNSVRGLYGDGVKAYPRVDARARFRIKRALFDLEWTQLDAVLHLGAISDNPNQVAFCSSRGPTADGRWKPNWATAG